MSTPLTAPEAVAAGEGMPDEKVPLSGWLGLLALSVVNIYALIDRQIFNLLAEPIRKEMNLSDTQLGLLQGVGLAIIGIITIYPIAWAGDRYDRRWISAAVITLWSVAVIGCGLSPNFAWLFFFASLVGIGESARAPLGFAMVPDLFPKSKRQLGNAVYTFVQVIAASVAIYLTGLLIGEINIVRPFLPPSLASLPDWRLSFIFAASFVPLAVLLTLTLPARTAGVGAVARRAREAAPEQAATAAATVNPDEVSIWRFIWSNRRVQLGFNGAMMLTLFGIAASTNFLAVIVARDYGQSPQDTAKYVAILGLVNAAIGFSIAGLLFTRLVPRYGARVPMMALTLATVLGIPASILLAQSTSMIEIYVYYCFLAVVLSIGSMTFPTILQNMTLPYLRARMFALVGITQLVAGGLGAVAAGLLSDVLKAAGVKQSLLIGGGIIAVICLAIAAVIFWRIRDDYMALTEKVNA